MSIRTIRGRVQLGLGFASKVMPESVMKVIRKRTGLFALKPGTLNVRIDQPHDHRRDYTLVPADRPDGYVEEWYFEICRIGRDGRDTRALILRTSSNHWGSSVLEIMAEEMLRTWLPVDDGQEVEVTIFSDLDEAQKAERSPSS